MSTEEQEWICIVCLKPVTEEEKPDAAQIEVEVDGEAKCYFMRHGSCEMTEEARKRLAYSLRGVREL